MESIWQWGLEVIRIVQSVHGPVLDTIFKGFTFLGEEDFFILLLPLILWCVDFPAGVRLAVAFLLSGYVNDSLKHLFAHPRPPALDPDVQRHFSGAEGYGLPSGHAQNAVVVWGVIAAQARKAWVWVVAVLLMILIGFSRIYLGVHFPHDVLAGWLVGGFVFVGYLVLAPRIERVSVGMQMAAVVLVPLLLMVFHLSEGVAATMGVLMGAGAGAVVTLRTGSFNAGGPVWQRALRFLVGAAVLMGLRYGLKALLPAEGAALFLVGRVVRYVVIGVWAGFGAPWLFVRLGLVPSDESCSAH